ncbi:MAG TPA: ABC transporter permease subunit, partial [Anaerolineae bacterium]|nr:ABC transporter permease subunit [Anaerolineae bacterium]
LDFNYVQAAGDLGANKVQVFLKVILPLTMPGVVAASIITFIPTLGAYVTPDLMGGGNTFLIGNLLQQQFMTVRDWPFGSALGFILMAMVLVATMIYFRTGGGRLA